MNSRPDQKRSVVDHAGPSDRTWSGLKGLSPALRDELAQAVTGKAVTSLEACLQQTLAHWRGGERAETDGEARWVWAHDLSTLLPLISTEFAQALTNDLNTTHYPPEYVFSGIAFADKDNNLIALDDYQSTRRSLRHELDAAIKSQRYSALLLQQAATQNDRFQHPNWAPWSPVHWFERLMEIAERHFGHTAKSLELARSYANCLAKSGSTLVPELATDIDSLGLVSVTEGPFERENTSEHGASWRNLVGSGKSDRTFVDTNLSPSGRAPHLDADNEQGPKPSSDPRPAFPLPEGEDEARWLEWVQNMLQFLVNSRSEPSGSCTATTVSRAEGGSGSVTLGDANRERLAQAADVSEHSRAALAPFVLDLLQGLFDHIFRQIGFNPRVRAAISDAQLGLARAVIRDLSFFRDRSHPLRLWIGSLINTGLRISPREAPLDNKPVQRYLERIEQSVARLRAEAEDMDRDSAQSLLNEWLAGIAEDGALWEEQQQSSIRSLEQNEHFARAWRSLRTCVLQTGANLPLEAADRIAEAWADLLAMEEGGTGTLHQEMKALVEGICRNAQPIEANPLVNRLLTHAREEGFPTDRITSAVTQLAKAHLQHSRARPGTTRFDPNAFRERQSTLRFEDDDPHLAKSQDEESLYQASRIRVGDWFEFVDRNSSDVQRMALIWRGEASRGFLFLSLDGTASRRLSLQGVAHEMRAGRMRFLPQDNPLDSLID